MLNMRTHIGVRGGGGYIRADYVGVRPTCASIGPTHEHTHERYTGIRASKGDQATVDRIYSFQHYRPH